MNLERDQLQRLEKAGSYEEMIALAKEIGLEIDEELDASIKTYFEKKANHLLSDEELDGVAGGEIDWGNGQGKGFVTRQEDARFAFNVGDEVEVSQLVFWTERGVITERKIVATNKWFESGYEPQYRVKYFKRLSPQWVSQDYLSY